MERINLQQIAGVNEEQVIANDLAGLEKSNPALADSLKRIREIKKPHTEQPAPDAVKPNPEIIASKRPRVSKDAIAHDRRQRALLGDDF